MARFIYLDGIDEAAVVRFPDGYEVTSAAEEGSVNTGRVEIDDPTGTLNIVPLKGAYIVETAAPAGNQRIWTGYLFNVTIDRGPYRNGPGRVWRADCVDVNFDLARRFFISANAFRPAETDVERLDWILNGNLATVNLVYQGSLTNMTDNIKSLDASDLRYVTPIEALNDMATQCGKRAFAFYNESTAKVELFYDLATAAVNTSSAKISNVASDLTIVNGAPSGGVWPPFIDGSLTRLGEEIASEWILRWVGGITTQVRSDTLATYGEHWFTSESTRIGRASTAAAWTAAALSAHEAPQDTLTCTLLLPPANVNDIKEGQRLQVKFSHLPDLTSYTYRRVTSRIVKVDPSDNYLVQLVIDNAIKTPTGGGGTGTFPHQTGCADVSIVQSVGQFNSSAGTSLVLPSPATAGNKIVHFWAIRDGNGSAPGGTNLFTVIDHIDNPTIRDGCGWEWRDAVAGETTFVPFTGDIHGAINTEHWLAEVAGDTIDTFAQHVSTDPYNSNALTGATVTPSSGSAVLILGGASIWGGFGAPTVTPDSGWTEQYDHNSGDHPWEWVASKVVSSASGSYTPSGVTSNNPMGNDAHGYGFITLAITCSSAGQSPLPGQWVYNETPTPAPGGGNTVFFTANPYASGSLQVFVDHVDQTAAVTETDPATGAFTLAFDPRSWETLLVNYQGAAG